MTDKRFFAGYGVCDITPPVGEFGSFRLAPNKRSLGVHDKLYTHALYLENGTGRILLVSVDCPGLSDDTVSSIKDELFRAVDSLEEAQILIAATHTHNGAETAGEEPLIDISAQIERVRGGIVKAASEAFENRFPARAAWGAADLPGIAKNRFAVRTGGDESNVDNRADFLKIEGEDGSYKGILWHFAAHPTSCMKAGYMNSADYYGAANRIIAEKLGGFCFFFNGACGNINLELGERNFERSEFFGARIAEKLLPEIPQTKTNSNIELKSASVEISIPLTEKIPDTTSLPSKEEIFEYFENIDSMDITPDEYEKYWPRYQTCRTTWWRYMLSDLLREKKSEEIKIAAHRIGNTLILAVPGEIFIELQFRLQEAFDADRAVIFGYSNGFHGYIPDPDSYEIDSYETIPTIFHRAGKDAGAKIIREGVKLIESLTQ